MSAPVINPITSVNALTPGLFWKFQLALTSGAAYKWAAFALPGGLSIQSSYAFTVDTGGSTFSAPSAPSNSLLVDTRVNMVSSTTLPSPFAASTDYWVIAGGQLSATKGGSAITITTTGTGTHYLWPADTFGRISGIPTDVGTQDVYDISVIAYDISAGASAAMVFPVAVNTTGGLIDASPQLNVDMVTAKVTIPGAASTDPFDLFMGDDNQAVFNVALFNGSNQLDVGQPPSIELLVMHDPSNDPSIMLRGGGANTKYGSGNTAVYQIFADFTVVPGDAQIQLENELAGNNDNQTTDVGVFINAWAQLRVTTTIIDPRDGVSPLNVTRNTQLFRLRVVKDFAP